MRLVSTRVLPDPAPATTSSGAPRCSTAARCGGLRPSSRAAICSRRCCARSSAACWCAADKAPLIRADADDPTDGGAGTVAVGGRSNRLVMTGTTLPGGTDSAVTCSSARRTVDRPDRGQPLLTGCTTADRCGVLPACLSFRPLAVHTHSESFSTGTGSRCPFAAETPATTTPRGPHRPGAFFVPGSSGPRQNEDAKMTTALNPPVPAEPRVEHPIRST